MSSLTLVLIYLLAAVLAVAVCRTLKWPPILGYLIAGIVISPHTFSLVGHDENVHYVAEFGVVFLMFLIGLEFHVSQWKRIGRHIFGLGFSQVALTLLIVAGLFMLINWLFLSSYAHYNWSWATAFTLGSIIAMSSTAIVMKIVIDRVELDSEHGKRILGILLFQDLAVVPLLIIIPALGSSQDSIGFAVMIALLKGSLLLISLHLFARPLLRRWLHLVAQRKSEELFMINLLLIALGLAWLTQYMGLSLALGAFVAGVLIADTPYKHQVAIDIRPFHDLLLGLFFITIGMLLDWRIVLDQWLLILALTVFAFVLKTALITVLARSWGAPLGTALRTGLFLAQAGEFGLVLLTLASEHSLIPAALLNPILASMILSMIATPFIIAHHEWWIARWASQDWLLQAVQMTHIARESLATDNHIIICGFGQNGQQLARIFQKENISFVALDSDPDVVQQFGSSSFKVLFGDASKGQTLSAAGLLRAKAVVITYVSSSSTLKVIAAIRHLSPSMPVIVRTPNEKSLEKLTQAGATVVIPENVEGYLMMASQALTLMGLEADQIAQRIQEQRQQHYAILATRGVRKPH